MPAGMAEYHKDIAAVRAFARDEKLRPATLAKNAGLSANALRDLDSSDWRPTTRTLDRLLTYIAGQKRAAKRKSAA